MLRRKRSAPLSPFDPEIVFELWADPTIPDRTFTRFLNRQRPEVTALLRDEPYSPIWLQRTDLPRWVTATVVAAHLREHGDRLRAAVLGLSEHWLRRHHDQVLHHIRVVEQNSAAPRGGEAGQARRLIEAITGRVS